MDVAVLTPFATPFMAMMAMLSHQQRSILKKLSENGERLAWIEGFLGVGKLPLASLEPLGRAWAPDGPEQDWARPWT